MNGTEWNESIGTQEDTCSEQLCSPFCYSVNCWSFLFTVLGTEDPFYVLKVYMTCDIWQISPTFSYKQCTFVPFFGEFISSQSENDWEITWHFTHIFRCPVPWPNTVKTKFLLLQNFLPPIKSRRVGNQHFCEKFPHSTRKHGAWLLVVLCWMPQGIDDQILAVAVARLNWTPQDYDVSMTLRQHIIGRKSQLCQSSSLRTKSPQIPGNLSMVRATFPFTLFNFPWVSSDWTLYNNHS